MKTMDEFTIASEPAVKEKQTGYWWDVAGWHSYWTNAIVLRLGTCERLVFPIDMGAYAV